MTPSGKGTASPRLRRTRAMLQTGHLEGQSERMPGSIGQKYSVSDEIADSEPPDFVNRPQYIRIVSQLPITTKTTAKTARKRSLATTIRKAPEARRPRIEGTTTDGAATSGPS